MRPNKLTRAAFATVAAGVALAPLAACSAPAGESPLAQSTSAGYQDGRYQAIGEYGGGPSHLDITVTIANSVVTDVTVKPMAENETSRGFQERFAAAVPDEVIGKSLDEAEVGKLAGASTCPDGFNDAIAQIRQQARQGN